MIVVALQSNAVPYQLKNGSVLLAGTCGSSSRPPLPGADGEQIQLLIAEPGNFFGPFMAVTARFGGALWMEDEPGEGKLQSTSPRRACCKIINIFTHPSQQLLVDSSDTTDHRVIASLYHTRPLTASMCEHCGATRRLRSYAVRGLRG